ncbi:hypothetical protein ACFL0M_06660 [Thermodesulfobacteriota bacterium]
MKNNNVLVIDADDQQILAVCSLLKEHLYEPVQAGSLTEMDRYLGKRECRAVIINLDSLSVTNKIFRELKRKKPEINIIALSGRQFHPELEDALRENISVCLGKPVDPDELIYWLNSIFTNNEKP